jgi:hypothetical protein
MMSLTCGERAVGKKRMRKGERGSSVRDFGRLSKRGLTGNPVIWIFSGRKVTGDEPFAGVLVSDEKMIAGGAGPGRVDLDGVGDDRDDGDTPSGGELSLNHVRGKGGRC